LFHKFAALIRLHFDNLGAGSEGFQDFLVQTNLNYAYLPKIDSVDSQLVKHINQAISSYQVVALDLARFPMDHLTKPSFDDGNSTAGFDAADLGLDIRDCYAIKVVGYLHSPMLAEHIAKVDFEDSAHLESFGLEHKVAEEKDSKRCLLDWVEYFGSCASRNCCEASIGPVGPGYSKRRIVVASSPVVVADKLQV